MEQRTPEWFLARTGKVTASRIADLMAKTKTGYSTSRANYAAQLVCEIMTGQPSETFSNTAMQWGTDQEPFARDAYVVRTGEFVDEVGFINHPTIDQAGASPDGMVGKLGLVEIKCPNTSTHIEYLLAGDPPQKYKLQMAWQMACTGREWCDFVSYDPRMPTRLQLMIVRYERDNDLISEIESEVTKFIQEVNATVKKLEELQ